MRTASTVSVTMPTGPISCASLCPPRKSRRSESIPTVMSQVFPTASHAGYRCTRLRGMRPGRPSGPSLADNISSTSLRFTLRSTGCEARAARLRVNSLQLATASPSTSSTRSPGKSPAAAATRLRTSSITGSPVGTLKPTA